MNWIMKAFSEAYSTALFLPPIAGHSRHTSRRAQRTCVRERACPVSKPC